MSVPFVERMKFVLVSIFVLMLGMSAAACEGGIANVARVEASSIKSEDHLNELQSPKSEDKVSSIVPEDESEQVPEVEPAPVPEEKPSGDGFLSGLLASTPDPLFFGDECITGLEYYYVDRQAYLHLKGRERYITDEEFIELFSQYDGDCLHQATGSHAPGYDFPIGELVYALCGDHPAVEANRKTLGRLARLAQSHDPSKYFTGIECSSGKKEEVIREDYYMADGGPATEKEHLDQAYELIGSTNFEPEEQAELEREWDEYMHRMQMK